MSWLLEFFISGTIWTLWNKLSPPAGVGEVDDEDVYGTFGPAYTDSTMVVDEKDTEKESDTFGTSG
jgi:NCS1 family nucleobase:cation symporter-1